MREPLGVVIDVIYQDEDYLVVNKPSGIPTTPSGRQPSSLREAIERQLGVVGLHATSRLDSPVTGAVIFSKHREATAHVLRARERGDYRRLYLAIAVGAVEMPASGEWDKPIGMHLRNRKLRSVSPIGEGLGVKSAKTLFRKGASLRIDHGLHVCLLQLQPVTGRTHQLRVHAADAGHPLWGDRAYSGPVRLGLGDGRVVEARRVMLHCAAVQLPRRRKADLRFFAPIPLDMREGWRGLGGDLAQLNLADSVFETSDKLTL